MTAEEFSIVVTEHLQEALEQPEPVVREDNRIFARALAQPEPPRTEVNIHISDELREGLVIRKVDDTGRNLSTLLSFSITEPAVCCGVRIIQGTHVDGVMDQNTLENIFNWYFEYLEEEDICGIVTTMSRYDDALADVYSAVMESSDRAHNPNSGRDVRLWYKLLNQ